MDYWLDSSKKMPFFFVLVIPFFFSVNSPIILVNSHPDPRINYNVRPPRYLSWFITPITVVYGTYNYSYWGLKTNL